MSNNNTEIEIFVVAASITAALSVAQVEAKKLSLTAKNARAIAIRAGQKALGFKVITDFIDEFANTTIQCAEQIAGLSLNYARLSMDGSLYKNHCEQLRRAHQLHNGETANSEVLAALITEKEASLNEIRARRDKLTTELESLLETIRTQMRASGFIAATSKVEASRAEEFKANLDSVALDIAAASERIIDCVEKSYRWLQRKGV